MWKDYLVLKEVKRKRAKALGYPFSFLRRWEKREDSYRRTGKAKEQDLSVKIKLTNDRVMINSQLVKPPLNPPKPTDILSLSRLDRIELEGEFEFVGGLEHTKLGSKFQATATNLNQLRQAYLSLLLDPNKLAATHNIAAYILPDGSSGYTDEGDYGIGRVIKKVIEKSGITKLVVFVIWYYGGEKLGYRTNELIKTFAQQILSSKKYFSGLLYPIIQKIPKSQMDLMSV